MADFSKAYAFLVTKEGSLSDHPADYGGQTYFGIARRFWPNWDGWQYVDANQWNLAQALVPSFYKEEYWDTIKGDLINSQLIANRLFEQAVNSNAMMVTKNLQEICNALAIHDNAVIAEDGKMGPGTMARLNAMSSKQYEIAIEFALRAKYLTFLLGRAKEDKTQRVFTLGWINREAV